MVLIVRIFLIAFILSIGLREIGHAQCNPPEGGEKEIALFNAIQRRDSNEVTRLLLLGANPNAHDNYGHTLLMCASRDDGYAPIAQLLIDFGANVNGQLRNGVTVLMYACNRTPNPEVISILLKSGADVNATIFDGSTALMDAALWGNVDAVQLLIAAGANVNALNHKGLSPISFAHDADQNRESIQALLVAAGADPNGSDAPFLAKIAHETAPHSIKDLLGKLQEVLSTIDTFYERSRSGNRDDSKYHDSLSDINEYLRLYLVTYLPRIPQTLTTTLSEIITYEPYNMSIHSSTDGMIRIWDWNTYTGGSCPTVYQLVEYRTPTGIRVYDPSKISYGEDMHNHWCDTIYTVRRTNGSVVYLPRQGWRADGMHYGQTIDAVEIVDTTLITGLKMFQTRKTLLSNILYCFPENRGHENIVKYLTVQDNGHTLFVPLVSDNDKYTSKQLRYEFDGDHFVYRGVTK